MVMVVLWLLLLLLEWRRRWRGEWWRKWWWRKVEMVAGQGKQGGCVGCWFAVGGLLEEERNERERKKGGGYIREGNGYYKFAIGFNK